MLPSKAQEAQLSTITKRYRNYDGKTIHPQLSFSAAGANRYTGEQ